MLLILLALSCPITKIENISGHPWNKHDQEVLEYVQKRCGQVYPDSPCVKLFRKREAQDYSVICGAKA